MCQISARLTNALKRIPIRHRMPPLRRTGDNPRSTGAQPAAASWGGGSRAIALARRAVLPDLDNQQQLALGRAPSTESPMRFVAQRCGDPVLESRLVGAALPVA
jgi:hypothetical protein